MLAGIAEADVLTPIIDLLGEDRLSWLGGLLVGGLFGFFAQRSRFCLRAAAVEFSRGQGGPRLAIWLLTFAAALMGTHGWVAIGWSDVSSARQLAQQGSISGAFVGGMMFGCGMILARGCATRLLVAFGQRQSPRIIVRAGVCGDRAGLLSRPGIACSRTQSVAGRWRPVARHHGHV